MKISPGKILPAALAVALVSMAIVVMVTMYQRYQFQHAAQVGAAQHSIFHAVGKLNLLLYAALASGFLFVIFLLKKVWGELQKQQHVEQKLRQEAEDLKASQAGFQLLVSSVKDYAIFLLDRNGIVRSWNSGAEHIKGYSADEIIGKHMSIFYTPEELQKGEPKINLDRALKNGHYETEGWRVRKDGSVFYANIVFTTVLDDHGEVYGFAKVTKDITEKKITGDRIAFLASIADNIQDPIICSGTDFRITSWNAGAEKLLGWRSDEVIGKKGNELLRVIYPQGKTEDIFATFSAKGFWQGELIFHAKSGAVIHVLTTASHLKDYNDNITGRLVLARDITRRKTDEAALNRLNKELEAATREMEAFTYSVSHDLRAPLRGIVGFASILEEEYAAKLDDEAKRITAVISSSALRMGQLIDDLLAFSRMGKKELIKTAIDTQAMVEEIVDEITQQNAMCNVRWEISPLKAVRGDRNMLRQVWVNLISNAVKYSGKQTLPAIKIDSFLQNGQIAFSVCDNGVGFEEQYKHKLFKVFQRLHSAEAFEGTGVGLALVEKIVTKHGGHVWAEGTTGKGACFYFSLPDS